MKKNTRTSKLIVTVLALCLVFATAVPASAATAVKLAKPANVKATLTAKYTSKITWNKVKNAKSYEVYYSVNGNAYKKLQTTTKVTATQKKLAPGKTYAYKVRAIKGNAKGAYSVVKKVKTLGTANPKLVATAINNLDAKNKVQLKWNAVNNATGYYVYKNTANGYKLIKTTTARLYKDATGDLGTKYTYKVVPYIKANGKIFKGTASVKSVTTREKSYLMTLMSPYRVTNQYDYTDFSKDAIQMGGEKYTHGFGLDVTIESQSAYFNLNGKYSTLSFVGGVDDEDTAAEGGGKVMIYSDGDLIYSYDFAVEDLPSNHTIDVKNCMQLEIKVEEQSTWGLHYGFAEMLITK